VTELHVHIVWQLYFARLEHQSSSGPCSGACEYMLQYCSVLFCKFYIRWRPIKASDELVGEL
jgi:hypothetical protein